MFNKNNAAKEYQIEVYKTVNNEDVKLDLDVRQTRFNPVEIIPDMAFSFTPKSDQNFAKEPGNYKARVRGVNSAGEGEWSDFAVFAVGGETENTGYQATGFNNSGAIAPNQWNSDKELKAELKDDGYHLTFTGSETNSWDSYVLGFDKTQPYTSLHMEFNLVKGNITKAQVEFCDWGNTEAESNDGKQQTEFDVVAGANSVDIAITTDLSKGLGQLALQLARQGAAIGEAEIVVTKMVLSTGAPTTSAGYDTAGFDNNGAIGLNEWNAEKDNFKATLQDDGYHLNFTGFDGGGQWDAYRLTFDKNAGYNTFEFEFKVLSGNCNAFQYEFMGTWDDASGSTVNSQSDWIVYNSTEYKGRITLDADKLAIGSGQLLLKMGVNGSAAGQCEILVTKMKLSIA